MHEYSFDAGRRKGSSLKRSMALSRREVSFEPQKKKKNRPRKGAPSSSSGQVSILTSSQPETSGEGSKAEERRNAPHATLNSIPSSSFYEKPKSLLEKQYERNLQRFVAVNSSDDFLALESEGASKSPADSISETHDKLVQNSIPTPDMEDAPKLGFSDILADPANEKEFHVTYFVHASDSFLRQAHSLVLRSNDVAGARVYYSLIRLALKSLHILIREYASNLNPALESVIYHKLGTIYLQETRALDKAEHFVNMAISLANKHSLANIKVISEFLYCQILEQSNSQALSSFAMEKQRFYAQNGYPIVADLYSLMRMNHLFLGDPSMGLSALNSLGLRKTAHAQIRSLSLLYEASANLYRGLFSSAKQSIESAQELFFDQDSPPQLIALAHLTMLACCVQSNDSVGGKISREKLSEFISSQRASDWAGWSDDGIFILAVPLFENDEKTSLFEVQWLNSDEYIILFYFLSGMLDILDHSAAERTKRLLTSCLEIINLQLGQLTSTDSESRHFRISFLTDSIVRLSFIRYSVIFYKIWIEFSHEGDFAGISSVQYFLQCFDEESFTKEEMCYYALLVPKFLYLAAVYFQAQGDLNAAKYYFLRIRKLSSPCTTDSIQISSIQKRLGIGCEMLLPKGEASELYLFSTLHLVLIAEHDLSVLAKTNPSDADNKSRTLACHGLLSDLLSDLSGIFDSGDSESHSDPEKLGIFYLSYRLVLLANGAKELSGNSGQTEYLSKIKIRISEFSACGFIKALSSYILYKYSTSLGESTAMLRETVLNMIGNDENSCYLGMLVLADEDAKALLNDPVVLSEVEARVAAVRSKLEKIQESARSSVHL